MGGPLAECGTPCGGGMPIEVSIRGGGELGGGGAGIAGTAGAGAGDAVLPILSRLSWSIMPWSCSGDMSLNGAGLAEGAGAGGGPGGGGAGGIGG